MSRVESNASAAPNIKLIAAIRETAGAFKIDYSISRGDETGAK